MRWCPEIDKYQSKDCSDVLTISDHTVANFSTDHAEAGALREATAEEGAGAGVGDHNAVVRRQELYTRAAK